jgi:hypothetical protein
MDHCRICVAEVERAGERHQAAYFVERGVIHASISGKIRQIPVSDLAPEIAVQRLLLGHLYDRARRATNSTIFGQDNTPPSTSPHA